MMKYEKNVYIPKSVAELYNYYIVEPLHPDYNSFVRDLKSQGYNLGDAYRFINAINKGAL